MTLHLIPELPSLTASLVAQGAKRSQLEKVLKDKAFYSVYQPIVDLHKGRIVGFECLTRFQSTPYRSPDKWFGDAAEVGLGIALELQTFKAALRECAALPASAFIALNVSPEAITSGWICAVLKVVNPTRVVLELTEHAPVADYDALNAVLNPLRKRGVRIAIDDVGAGYANLQHILEMRPDILKLDVSLTKDIDICPARATLMGGLVQFARTLGSEVLAEGVEAPDQLAALRALGVDMVQGYLFGKPEEACRFSVRQ